MTTGISFIAYPVSDVTASREFFETVLGTKGTATNDEWVEYDIGHATFVITQADDDHPVPVRGALVAFEVPDVDAEVARLRSHSIKFCGEIVETSICRFIIALDPDGSEFLIHQRKPPQ